MLEQEQLKMYTVILQGGRNVAMKTTKEVHVGATYSARDEYESYVNFVITSISGTQIEGQGSSIQYELVLTGEPPVTITTSDIIEPGKFFIYDDLDGNRRFIMTDRIEGNHIYGTQPELSFAEEKSKNQYFM
jgi:hypothetical protein